MELFDTTSAAKAELAMPNTPSLEDEIEVLYGRIFEVAAQRRALKDELTQAFQDRCGFDSGAVDEVMRNDDISEKELAKELLRSMLSESARRRIGINQSVSVDTYEFHTKFLAPIEEAYNKRYSYHRRDKTEPPPAIPRLDVRGAITYLRETYGGNQGERLRIEQVVASFKNELQLDRNRFEAKAGKVSLEFRIYSADWELKEWRYGSGARQTLFKVANGFIEMFDHFGEDVPAGLACFRRDVNRVCPGETYDLGPSFKLRTFKSHVRLTMTEGLADKLREFVVEFS